MCLCITHPWPQRPRDCTQLAGMASQSSHVLILFVIYIYIDCALVDISFSFQTSLCSFALVGGMHCNACLITLFSRKWHARNSFSASENVCVIVTVAVTSASESAVWGPLAAATVHRAKRFDFFLL